MSLPPSALAGAPFDLSSEARDLLQVCRDRGVFFEHNGAVGVLFDNLVAGFLALGVPCWTSARPGVRVPRGLGLDPERHHRAEAAVLVVEASNRLEPLLDPLEQAFFAELRALEREFFLTNSADNCNLILYPPDMAVLSAHENRFLRVAGRRVPGSFGLTARMLETVPALGTEPRRPAFLKTFRPSLNQGVRDFLELIFVPRLEKFFEVPDQQIGLGRTNAEFLQGLAQAVGCLAYGGFSLSDVLRNPFFQQPLFQENLSFLTSPVILRWDSWRFWECLITGTVALTLDMDLYGFDLPVMPQNWVHYVGIDLGNLDRDLQRLHDERDRLPEIGHAGRSFALSHYLPQHHACRFLESVTRWRDQER